MPTYEYGWSLSGTLLLSTSRPCSIWNKLSWTLIKGAPLALDTIIIPNYSAVEPKGYCPSRCTAGNHYNCHYALGDECDAARLWKLQKLTEPAISLAVLWDRTARPQHCLRKKLLVERTNSAVPQCSISGLHNPDITCTTFYSAGFREERDDLRLCCRMSWK